MSSHSNEEKGAFWIEFAPPFTDKLSKLKEFVDEHDLLGSLDRRFLRQILESIQDKKLLVTKFKAGIKKAEVGKHRQLWTSAFTINGMKEFKGEAENLAEAFLRMAEDYESYFSRVTMN